MFSLSQCTLLFTWQSLRVQIIKHLTKQCYPFFYYFLHFHLKYSSKHSPPETKSLEITVFCNMTPCLAFCLQDGGSKLFRNNRKFYPTARCHIPKGSSLQSRPQESHIFLSHNVYSVLNARAQVSNPYRAEAKSREHSPAKTRAEPDAIGHSGAFTTGFNELPARGPEEAAPGDDRQDVNATFCNSNVYE